MFSPTLTKPLIPPWFLLKFYGTQIEILKYMFLWIFFLDRKCKLWEWVLTRRAVATWAKGRDLNRLRYKHRQYESVKVLLQIQSKVSPVVWLCRTEWSLGWVNWGVCVCVCVFCVNRDKWGERRSQGTHSLGLVFCLLAFIDLEENICSLKHLWGLRFTQESHVQGGHYY